MAHSDPLHLLIHSLSKTEKKYFKETSNGQNYVKLFDAINAQTEYDEEKLKKKFKNETFTNNFSAAKNYLREAILRSLRNFNSGKMMDDVSYERLMNLKLMHEKGLSNEVEKQLPKLKEFCYKYELFMRLLEVLSFEMQLNNSLVKSNENLYQERFRLIRIIENITTLNQIYGKLMAIAANKGHNNVEESAEINELMKNPILQEKALCGTQDELYALWNVFFVYHYISKNFKESYLAKKKQFELYQNSDVLIKTKPQTFLLLLGNLNSLAYNSFDLKEFQFAYTEMLKAHEQIQGYESLKFEQRSSFGLLMLRLKKDYSALEEMVSYIEQNIDKNKITLVREMDTYFNVAVAFFRKKKFSKALDWINRILHHKRAEERQQIQRIARHLELLIHYELNNSALISYKITNSQRYLSKRNILDEFDRILLSGFKNLINATLKTEKKTVLSQMKNDIAVLQQKSDKNNHGYFEYSDWIEEKLQLLN